MKISFSTKGVLFVDQNLLPEVNSQACDYIYNYFLQCTLLTLRYSYGRWHFPEFLACDVHDQELENLNNSNKGFFICATVTS